MIFFVLNYRLLLLSTVYSSSSSPSLESYDGDCEILSLRSFCESCAEVNPPTSTSLISDLFKSQLWMINLIGFRTIKYGYKLILNSWMIWCSSDDGTMSTAQFISNWLFFRLLTLVLTYLFLNPYNQCWCLPVFIFGAAVTST